MWGKVQPAMHKLTALAKDQHLLSSSQGKEVEEGVVS